MSVCVCVGGGVLTVQKRRLEQRQRSGDLGGKLEPEREQAQHVLDLLDQVLLDAFGLRSDRSAARARDRPAVLFYGLHLVGGVSAAGRVQQDALQQAFEQARGGRVGGRAQRPVRPDRRRVRVVGGDGGDGQDERE